MNKIHVSFGVLYLHKWMNDLKFISAFGETLEISFHKDFNRKKRRSSKQFRAWWSCFCVVKMKIIPLRLMISIKSTFLVYRSTTILSRKYYYSSQFFYRTPLEEMIRPLTSLGRFFLICQGYDQSSWNIRDIMHSKFAKTDYWKLK